MGRSGYLKPTSRVSLAKKAREKEAAPGFMMKERDITGSQADGDPLDHIIMVILSEDLDLSLGIDHFGAMILGKTPVYNNG